MKLPIHKKCEWYPDDQQSPYLSTVSISRSVNAANDKIELVEISNNCLYRVFLIEVLRLMISVRWVSHPNDEGNPLIQRKIDHGTCIFQLLW